MRIIGYILAVAMILVTVVGIGIGIWSYTSHDAYINEKEITLSDQTSSTLEVHLGGITPGDKVDYTLHLNANRGDGFQVEMQFAGTGNTALAPYIDVEILLGTETVVSASLADLLEGESASFSADFTNTKNVDVTVIYKMKTSVGNEAQGAIADFDVILNSKRF